MRQPVTVAPGVQCGRCGSPVFVTKACCNLRSRGWETMVKCMRGCGWRKAYTKVNVA